MDSARETLEHRSRVLFWIKQYLKVIKKYTDIKEPIYLELSSIMFNRAKVHDESKLHEPEKSIFDKYTPMLKTCTYGSDEYKEHMAGLGVALKHHYANNSHHPEYFKDGVESMHREDLIEMLCDWIAATERHSDGDIFRSIVINQDWFKYDNNLKCKLWNTALLMKGLVVDINDKPILGYTEYHLVLRELQESHA